MNLAIDHLSGFGILRLYILCLCQDLDGLTRARYLEDQVRCCILVDVNFEALR